MLAFSYVFYEVYVDGDMKQIKSRTDPIFNGYEYPNCRVTALYDAEADRVYLIQKL